MTRLRGLIAVFGVAFGLAQGVAPAWAAVPEDVLAREYQTCVGGDSDPARAVYCECVREGMRTWDDATFAGVAAQAAAASAPTVANAPEKLAALAQQCIARALR